MLTFYSRNISVTWEQTMANQRNVMNNLRETLTVSQAKKKSG